MKAGHDFIGVGCGAFIVNEKNELLLMKRGKASKLRVGDWIIPGGTVEFNETISAALKREVKEEVGLDIAIHSSLVHVEDILVDEGQHWIGHQFLCSVIGGTLENKEPHKCEYLGWFPLDNLPEPLAPQAKMALALYLEQR
jgi:8-oxo-dGTP diphosphatase